MNERIIFFVSSVYSLSKLVRHLNLDDFIEFIFIIIKKTIKGKNN